MVIILRCKSILDSSEVCEKGGSDLPKEDRKDASGYSGAFRFRRWRSPVADHFPRALHVSDWFDNPQQVQGKRPDMQPNRSDAVGEGRRSAEVVRRRQGNDKHRLSLTSEAKTRVRG